MVVSQKGSKKIKDIDSVKVVCVDDNVFFAR
jgi:hypothetical protein